MSEAKIRALDGIIKIITLKNNYLHFKIKVSLYSELHDTVDVSAE